MGFFELRPPVAGSSNRLCSPLTPCSNGEIVKAAPTYSSNWECDPKPNPPLDSTQVTVLVVSGIIVALLIGIAVVGSIRNKNRKSAEDSDDVRLLDLNPVNHDDDHLLDMALSNAPSIYE
jgi:hypothetical protein